MTPLLTPIQALTHLLIFGFVMVGATYFGARRVGNKTLDGFLVVNRRVPWWLGGPAITASWTWAVALMVSVQMSYEQGLAGIFWFTVPNVIAVLVYIWLGPAIRRKLPQGYSLPEWIHTRFSDKRVTGLYLFVFVYYQIMAVLVQIYAGAHVLSAATGISPLWLMPAVLIITLAYALISGMEASVLTDLLQTALLLVPGWLIVLLIVRAAGGHFNFEGVGPGGGLNPFSPYIALTAGVISSVGLISGAICDQEFWQRCFSIKESDLKKSFVFGAILFATIPVSLSLLGFVAASPEVGLVLSPGFDKSLVGFAIVGHLLPWAAVLYLYMILAGLCSTLDSALSAVSSLCPLIVDAPWKTNQRERRQFTLGQARLSMVLLGVVGLALSYGVEFIPGFGLKYLWWFFNTMAACVVVPTVLSLFWDRLSARGVLVGSGIGIAVGLPLVVYASIMQNDPLLSAAYAGVILVSLCACLFTATPKNSVK